ncbi:hypothetical protein ACNOYE_36895 [Nannocystaceae bacterium ST9]
MAPPAIDPLTRLDTVEFTDWRGLEIDVERAYALLTARGWKVDTEESNLMNAMSRTWRAEGIKVWLTLEEFVCAPPFEQGRLATIQFYRFDPATMPTTTMREKLIEPHEEDPPAHWYAAWQWLIDHGDPQYATFELLEPIAFGEVPPELLRAAWADLEAALDVDG